MWLIKLEDNGELSLIQPPHNDIPKYAILSHTWEPTGEYTFDDLKNGTGKHKSGYRKVMACAKKARQHDFQYCWVDTCSIDKSSSAELSEAINSMYQWYEEAEICYVYLADYHGTEISLNQFRQCSWFSRGWTLQELLAPERVKFYNKDWQSIGDKHQLSQHIETICGIPSAVLYGLSARECTVAARLSWVAERHTTRPEDIAYCLLGLFDVNLSPIYGEGAVKAFMRLQEEILKRWRDQTIFLWTPAHEPRNLGLLASSPASFCRHMECRLWRSVDGQDLPEHPYSRMQLVHGASYALSQDSKIAFSDNRPPPISPTSHITAANEIIATPNLGPYGLLMSLLLPRDIESYARMTAYDYSDLRGLALPVCLDVAIQSSNPTYNGALIILLLRGEISTGRYDGNHNGRGLWSRWPGVHENASPRLVYEKLDRTTFQRQSTRISQQVPLPVFTGNARFMILNATSSASLKGGLIKTAHGWQEISPESICVDGCGGVIGICYSVGPSWSTVMFYLFFGMHGKKATAWCHASTEATESNTDYYQSQDMFEHVESFSTSFSSRCHRGSWLLSASGETESPVHFRASMVADRDRNITISLRFDYDSQSQRASKRGKLSFRHDSSSQYSLEPAASDK